jgi:hypothetical protein
LRESRRFATSVAGAVVVVVSDILDLLLRVGLCHCFTP